MVAAITMAVYALAVIALSLAPADDFGPPDLIPQGISIGLVLLVPAGVAAIGAIRRSRPLLAAAGALALLPSLFAPGFIAPTAVLLWLGGIQRGSEPVAERDVLVGVAVVLLGYAALLVPNALTEPRCWTATQGPGGTLVYAAAPITDTLQLGPGQVGAGCESSVQTVQGAGVGLVLAIGAVAIAALASAPTARLEPAR